MIDVAVGGTPPLQRHRLEVLMASEDRTQALAALRREGDEWNKSSVCMTLTRYSEKIDRFLQAKLDWGLEPEEVRHGAFFDALCRILPGRNPGAGPQQNTLAWFLRCINQLPPAERQALVAEIFRTQQSPAPDPSITQETDGS
jgi:hypothetical protein